MKRRQTSGRAATAALAAILVVTAGVRWREPKPWTIAAAEAPYRIGGALLFVYDPRDCEVYRPLVNRLEEAYGRGLDIRGIPVRRPEGRAPAAAEVVARPGFPDASHLARPAARALMRLGYRYTPLLVSVDRHGRIRHVVELPGPAVEQRRTLSGIGELLRPRGET